MGAAVMLAPATSASRPSRMPASASRPTRFVRVTRGAICGSDLCRSGPGLHGGAAA